MQYNNLWDPNDDKERQFDKFNKYYEDFSNDTRNDMLSRNVNAPSNAYDVLYPESREKLISKNVPKTTDILGDSEVFRQAALAKIVPVVSDIELLADAYRDAQLAKNVVNETSVLEISDQYRHEQLSKNEDQTSVGHISNSQADRQQQLSKNVPNNSDLEKDTESYRQGQLSNNVAQNSDIEKDTEQYRQGQLANNVPENSDLEKDTETYRRQQLANNVPENSDLEKDTEQYRADQLSNNVPASSSIEKDTEDYRQGQLGNNVPAESNLEQDTQVYREGQLGNNVPSESDLESSSKTHRADQLGNNVPAESSIDKDTEDYREGQLGNNVPSESDLEKDSEIYREGQLGNTVPSESDIEKDAEQYRADQLGNNVPSESNLEDSSGVYREGQLGNTVPSESDIEKDTEQYRADQLGNNVPSESDLEKDSEPYRDSSLGNNVPSESDLETDSVPFRESDLGNNVPSESDLETDSVPFRESDLSNNVPSESNLEEDSIPFRESDLSNNVPSESNLEEDSIPFRESDLSNNVPSESSLEIDSVPFREDDLSNNVPSESNLLEDSAAFREDDLANNVPSESDLFIDSEEYREEDLASNVPSGSDLLIDTFPYLQEQLSANVGAVSDIDEDSEPYREEMLASNVPGHSSVLDDSIAARNTMLSKNLQGGLFGLNIEGFGTQAFIGVSRNFSFGILVREALLSRNKYSTRRVYNPDLEDGLKESNTTSYFQDTTRSQIEEMHLRNGQRSLGYRKWSGQAPILDKDVSLLFKQSLMNNPTDTPFADDFMSKSMAGNPLDIPEFADGPKSIKTVIDRIANEAGVRYAQNYKQGQREFVIGTDKTTGEPRFARQRYSVSNPYAPKDAGELIFSITNYAIENSAAVDENGKFTRDKAQLKTMYFPPYISSFQENETANWNENAMLGRPEPVFTYNNSRREGSINFYVLTDYAQQVELGVQFNGTELEPLTYDFAEGTLNNEGFHFTDLGEPDFEGIGNIEELKADLLLKQTEISKNNEEIRALREEIVGKISGHLQEHGRGAVPSALELVSSQTTQANAVEQANEQLQIEAASIDAQLNNAIRQKSNSADGVVASVPKLSENFIEGGNIYNPANLLDLQLEPNGDSRVTTVRNVVGVLDDLKSNLAFQPAFFSGDKVDFKRRMSFLSKLTRPREKRGAEIAVGSSFTVPPVAHIRLGDWINHDAIITSVNKDYSDTVWCLQNGSVQPLWAQVTVSFVLIGSYGRFENSDSNNITRPLTASDLGGYYGPRSQY